MADLPTTRASSELLLVSSISSNVVDIWFRWVGYFLFKTFILCVGFRISRRFILINRSPPSLLPEVPAQKVLPQFFSPIWESKVSLLISQSSNCNQMIIFFHLFLLSKHQRCPAKPSPSPCQSWLNTNNCSCGHCQCITNNNVLIWQYHLTNSGDTHYMSLPLNAIAHLKLCG